MVNRMAIDQKTLSLAINMLKSFAADQIALEPELRDKFSWQDFDNVIEKLESELPTTDKG
jgi:hypothetical protein